MRILMLCTKYALEPGDDYLTNELALALVAQGHDVEVALLDWASTRKEPCRESTVKQIRVISTPAFSIERFGRPFAQMSKWTMSSFFATIKMRKCFQISHFDVLVAFSPLSAVAIQVLWAIRRFRTRNYLILWDFFPYHHRGIGLIGSRPVFFLARALEQFMMRRFHVIGCMSPRNVEFLRDRYDLRANQQLEVLPIWGTRSDSTIYRREEERAFLGIPNEKKIAVFGGQLVEGRGLEDIIAAARILQRTRHDIAFLVVGSGRLSGLVEAEIRSGAKNVMLYPRVAREKYLRLISACDVGLISTVRNVEVPTFPSKIIDYLRVGLPVVASVEESTDFGDFVTDHGLGIALTAGDAAALAVAIVTAIDDPKLRARAAQSGQRVLADVFDVDRVAHKLVSSIRGSHRWSPGLPSQQ